MIHFDRFGWRFARSSSWAVRDVCLHIRRGEFVAIAGPSGSGKTTLGLAMCGLLIGRHAGEACGSIHVDGRDVAGTPLHQTAQTIGLVQQNPEGQFATLTVSDEVAFGMENRCLGPDHIRRQCTQAMELLSITHLRERSLATLSGGEKQRVAVASLIAGQPEALVLDEPTASLDPEASRDLFGALADLCRQTGLTVVIIEHKLAQLLPLEPRLIRLKGGRVVEESPPKESCQLSAISRQPSASSSQSAGRPMVTIPWEQSCRSGGRDAATGSDKVTAPLADALVEMNSVTVELGGRTILDRVSLEVRAGEMVAVLGPNGGGKSTLLHTLLGLVEPVSGSVRACGLAVSAKAVSRLAASAGLVFQNADHQLVADSVWGEALFAARSLNVLEPATEQEADRLLERADLAERKADHPFRLSWGQKRRLNLISAILHGPSLLLLDEPFAGQDWENVIFLLDVLRDRLSGRADAGACLMVTHDPRVVLRSCTRLLFLSEGRITVDAPVPQAFDRLLESGHDAYVPVKRLS